MSRGGYHEQGCSCGYLNPVTEWAGGIYLKIVAYECPECKKRTPIEKMFPKWNKTNSIGVETNRSG